LFEPASISFIQSCLSLSLTLLADILNKGCFCLATLLSLTSESAESRSSRDVGGSALKTSSLIGLSSLQGTSLIRSLQSRSLIEGIRAKTSRQITNISGRLSCSYTFCQTLT
jgi:hypothetical protein